MNSQPTDRSVGNVRNTNMVHSQKARNHMKKLIPSIVLACLLTMTAASAAVDDPNQVYTGTPAIKHVSSDGTVTYSNNGKPTSTATTNYTTTTSVPMFGPNQPITSTGTAAPTTSATTYTSYQYAVPASVLPSGYSLSSGETISIDDVEKMVRDDNLNVRMMEQQLKAMEDVDIDDAVDMLNAQANTFSQQAAQIQTLLQSGQVTDPAMIQLLTSNATILGAQAAQLKSQASSTEDEFEEQLDSLEQQFDDAEDQLVFAAESTFIGIKSMEGSYADLLRQRITLQTTVSEMEARYKLGQISALQLQETQNGLTQLDAGISTLAMTIENTKGDLNLLLGRDADDSFTLAALPVVTDSQIAAINYESDLKTVKKKSTEIRDADDKRDDADGKYAEKAADLAYDNTVNTVSQNFQKLCRAVADKRQLVTAAQSDYALAQKNFQVQETKFKNGQISQNTYNAAKATLETAANAVTTAQNNLYTAYMKYEWAMKGIVSAS